MQKLHENYDMDGIQTWDFQHKFRKFCTCKQVHMEAENGLGGQLQLHIQYFYLIVKVEIFIRSVARWSDRTWGVGGDHGTSITVGWSTCGRNVPILLRSLSV